MTIETAFYTVEFWFSVALLIIFLYGPWQKFIESAVRQKLFKARDDLFVYAAEGNISFDSEHYLRVRGSLNKFIRFAHAMTWVDIVVGRNVFPKSESETGLNSLLIGDETLECSVRDNLNNTIALGISAMILLIVFRSPFLMLASVCLIPIMKFVSFLNGKDYQAKSKKFVGGFLYSELSHI